MQIWLLPSVSILILTDLLFFSVAYMMICTVKSSHSRHNRPTKSQYKFLCTLFSQMPQMPWICGDTTMLEQIERKRTLCMEIRSRQHPHLQRSLERLPPPDRNEDRLQERSHCKQESAPVLPGWGKSSGTKKIRPPPYPTQTTVFWDTAI